MSFDFDAAVVSPHRMQPGLRRLSPGARQLTPAVQPHRGVSRHLREKLAVLGYFSAQALLCEPGFDPDPALQALAGLAAKEQPQAFQWGGPAAAGRWCAPALGWAVDAADQPQATGSDWPEVGPLLASLPAAWRRPALLSLAFEEDFAILDGVSGHLPWLAVALPSMWAPEHKVGRHFTAVHAPVADNRLIVGAAAPLLALVTGAGAERWERFVWTISPHPRLHAHPQRVDPARWPVGLDDDGLAAQAWWRTERQTFLPVAPRAQAVFTIKVDVSPLATALQRPAHAARVHAALATMSPAVLAYRGLDKVQAALLRWLARRAAA